MNAIANAPDRRDPAPFQLYSRPSNHKAHRIRFVIAEKHIEFKIKELVPVQEEAEMEQLLQHNPQRTLPHLSDRDIHLFDSMVAIEYIDERYPQPALMPSMPTDRARIRMLMSRFNHEWNDALHTLETQPKSRARCNKAREKIGEDIMTLAATFRDSENRFLLSKTMTLADCVFATVLWRLPYYKIKLPDNPSFQGLRAYEQRMFQRESFLRSLQAGEKEMRPELSARLAREHKQLV